MTSPVRYVSVPDVGAKRFRRAVSTGRWTYTAGRHDSPIVHTVEVWKAAWTRSKGASSWTYQITDYATGAVLAANTFGLLPRFEAAAVHAILADVALREEGK